jgi:MinD-like ATPase involved in chromosome partitioning or flagellar assembly
MGRTTLAFLLADVLAAKLDARALAVTLSGDRERMALPVPSDGRSALDLGDLLADLDGFDDAARIHPYVSTARSGLHTLSGPRDAGRLDSLTAEQLQALLEFAARFYELVVLDVGELPEEAQRAAVERADQVVLLGAADAGDELAEPSPAVDAVESLRSERATLVLNRVDRELAVAGPAGRGPHALVPEDRDLIRALDSGDFELDRLEPATRVALKRLGLVVAEGLR